MMKNLPFFISGIAIVIVIYLILEIRESEAQEPNTRLNLPVSKSPKIPPRHDRAFVGSRRTRSIGNKQTSRTPSPNYSHLEQGLQVSLPKLYGEYLDTLGLSPSEQRYFESLLVERLMAQQHFAFEFMGANDAQRKSLIAKIEKNAASSDQQIREFLNHQEDHSKFLIYEKQIPERTSLDKIRPLLSGLTPEKEDRLVEILYECRVKSEGESRFWEPIVAMTDSSVMKERWHQADQDLAQRLPSILTSEQTRVFLHQWKSIRSSQEKHYELIQSQFVRDR